MNYFGNRDRRLPKALRETKDYVSVWLRLKSDFNVPWISLFIGALPFVFAYISLPSVSQGSNVSHSFVGRD